MRKVSIGQAWKGRTSPHSHLAAPDCKEPWEGQPIAMNEGVKTFGGELSVCVTTSNTMRVRNTPHSAFHTASQRLLTSGNCCYFAAVSVALSLVIIRPANAIMKSLHDLDFQK